MHIRGLARTFEYHSERLAQGAVLQRYRHDSMFHGTILYERCVLSCIFLSFRGVATRLVLGLKFKALGNRPEKHL